MDKFVIDTCYDEEKTAYDILVLKKERRTTLKRHIENKACSQYYALITKYLLKQNYSIDNIKEIIRKHIALVAYMIIREKDPGKYIEENSYLNKLLYGKEITIEAYLKDIGPVDYFEGIYDTSFELYHYNDYETIKESIAEICNIYEGITGNNNLFSLLKNILDYFYYGCQFADLKYVNHSDLLISYSLNNEELKCFSFEPLDDVYKDYFISTQSFKGKDIKERILGHIINVIFENDNLNYAKEMEIMPNYYYEIMFNQERKKYIQDTYSFFDVDHKTQTATINVEKIKKSFKFKYNNECYIFTREGIVKI